MRCGVVRCGAASVCMVNTISSYRMAILNGEHELKRVERGVSCERQSKRERTREESPV